VNILDANDENCGAMAANPEQRDINIIPNATASRPVVAVSCTTIFFSWKRLTTFIERGMKRLVNSRFAAM
jgi:hypothetical protein